MYFITWGETKPEIALPKATPSPLAKPKAKITAIKTVHVDFELEDAAIAANWVLSPISAKKIVTKVLKNIFQSIIDCWLLAMAELHST